MALLELIDIEPCTPRGSLRSDFADLAVQHRRHWAHKSLVLRAGQHGRCWPVRVSHGDAWTYASCLSWMIWR